MSSNARTLPAGWSAVLDEVHARLDEAITSANARNANLPCSSAESLVSERHKEITLWNERLRRLSTFLESAEQTVQSLDEILKKQEAELRQQLAACETLRQKVG